MSQNFEWKSSDLSTLKNVHFRSIPCHDHARLVFGFQLITFGKFLEVNFICTFGVLR